jgi:hypothetical protein
MSADLSHHGLGNGRGGRTYDSVDQIRQRAVAEHAVVTKAETAPQTLTDEDLATLPGEITARLMRDGKLTHLGLGASRRPKPGRRQ